MKIENKRIFFRLSLIFLFVFNSLLFAENQIFKVDINPLNRAVIYFSELVPQFSTELSADKKKIIIRLKGVNLTESLRETKSSGIIQSVYISKYGNDIEINILMKEKRGFSAVILPYSNAIMIESFDWSKITNGEDNYYSGLIAFNDALYTASMKYFNTAENENLPNASAFAGIVNLMEANLSNAETRLLKAEKLNTNINDVFAALSHLYKLKKNDELSDHYKNLFIQKSGLKSFNYINIGQIKSTEINTDSSLSLLDKNFINNEKLPLNNTKIDSVKKDSSSSAPVVIQNKAITKDNESFFNWIISILKYIGIFVIIFLMLLFVFYLKWRNSQMKLKNKLAEGIKNDQEQIKRKKLKADKAKPGVYQTSTRNAANIYKRNDDILRIQKPQPDEHFKNISDIKQLALEIIESKNSIDIENETLEEHIQNEEIKEQERSQLFAIPEKIAKDHIIDEEIIDDIDEEVNNDENKQVNSRFEFARHLQKEQQKIKEEKMKNMDLQDDEDHPDKLSELAKNAGIEKSALETKKNIADLQSDQDLLSKLSEKFSVKKK
jgi:hypothetical protein